ncbi:MAG: hypothetical protein IE916_03740 [Epsilonproteobacteria bacterium]|nr:hypothetical protein [Campylobacterota bacterium]
MREVLSILALILACENLGATVTQTTLGTQKEIGMDEHGSMRYSMDVTIDTQNFEIETFWNRFSNNGKGERSRSFDSISKSGTVEVTLEASSICSLYPELDAAGCSGQRPFLMNDEALSGVNLNETITLLFQKSYDGTNITYSDANGSVFYPLDIERDEKYYKTEGQKSFKSFFATLFDTFFEGSLFSGFFSHAVETKDSLPAEDIRQRYIANIVSGLDQNHLLEKSKTALSTDALNSPVSLIDYSEAASASGSCSLFFFKFSSDNFFCNMMSAMPFISMFTSSTQAVNYTIDTIQADTQNALIAFAGSYASKTVTTYQEGIVYQKQSSSSGIIGTMISMMKCFFFGCSKVNDVAEPMDSYYAFDESDAPTLTMAVTNEGEKVDDFATFKLMGIHSLSGNEHMCQVKKTSFIGGWTKTFRATDSQTKEQCTRYNIFGQCTQTQTVANTVDGKTPSEWLSWCDGIMSDFTPSESCKRFFIFENCTSDEPKEGSYTIKSYTNEAKVGLLLDLKFIKLVPSDKAIKMRYKLTQSHK